MKKITLLPLLFISTLTYAYELVDFSSSPIRSIDEILSEVQMNTAELSQFKCNNPERYKLFAQTPIQNLKKDSLKIINRKDEVYTYIGGKVYDEQMNKVRRVRGYFLKKAVKALDRISINKEGKRLISELSFAPKPFYIKRGGNRYMPSNPGQRGNLHGNNAGFISMMDELKPLVDGMPFNQIGYGGTIYWEPQTQASFIEIDYKKRSVDQDLILAHEMYHAYDGMRGLLDRRFVKSKTYEFTPVCEYRAVRFENIMRTHFGDKIRRYYSGSKSDPKDLLDDNDKMIILPTPCIKWL